MIGELRQELTRINHAIAALEHLSAANGRRRGRPPKWLKELASDSSDKRSDSGEQDSKRSKAHTA
jgi:hypothetical protein